MNNPQSGSEAWPGAKATALRPQPPGNISSAPPPYLCLSLVPSLLEPWSRTLLPGKSLGLAMITEFLSRLVKRKVFWN